MRHTQEMMAVQSIIHPASSSLSPPAAVATNNWLDTVALVQLQCLLPSLSSTAVTTSPVVIPRLLLSPSRVSCCRKFQSLRISFNQTVQLDTGTLLHAV